MDFLLTFTSVTVFTLMLTLGVNHSFAQLAAFWQQPQVLFRSLLAVLILVPLVVALLLWVFRLPPAVATGLAVLAAAPGAPLTSKRSKMAGGDLSYARSLQLTLALLAVAATPAILGLFYRFFELETERVTPLEVGQQVAMVTFLPAIIGLLLQRYVPKFVEVMGKPLDLLANALFFALVALVVVALALAPQLRAMLLVGWLPAAAIVLMATAALAVGHLLGGPDRKRRATLATASLARNIGLALFIAGLSDYGQRFIPMLLAYMMLGALVAIPYGLWNKRQLA